MSPVSTRRFAARSSLQLVLPWLCIGSAWLPGADVTYLDGHTEPVREIGVSPNGDWLVSVGNDGRLIVRPMDDLQQSNVFQPREGGLMCLAFTQAGDRVYAAGNLADFGRTSELLTTPTLT